MKTAACLGLLLTFTATLYHAQGVSVQPDPALRGSTRLQPDRLARAEHTQSWDLALTSVLSRNETATASLVVPGRQPHGGDWDRYGKLSQEQVADWKLKDKPNSQSLSLNASSTNVSTFVASNPYYVGCPAIQQCTVNTERVAADLAGRVVLFLGCSLDIYALDYFCKSANAMVVGYTRNAGNDVWSAANFAYCNIGGLVLAYSFQPGASGPPYFEGCDKLLYGRCSQVTSKQLAQESVARVVQTFGKPPSAIVVDSSLWDAANWWAQAGRPPEPYLVDAARVNLWCWRELPDLINAVQMTSPTSAVGYRTAPRVEPSFGYGHSMHNIDLMNTCLRSPALSHNYHLIDYNLIVDTLLADQGVPNQPKPFYQDPFHPGVVLSVLYIDSVMQWVKSIER